MKHPITGILSSQKPWRAAFNRHFEWVALLAGVLLMAGVDPQAAGSHGYCPLEWAGLTFCPGEGLGRSIASALRGDMTGSLQFHMMGIPGLFILGGRITWLFYRNVLKT